MFIYIILLFTVLPALELAILIKVGTYIGVGNTLFLIILTGVVGASLARYQGFVVLSKIQENLNRGNMPSSEMIDGLMILVGGVVLLTPGFITDAIGFFLLIPFTRALLKLWIQRRFEQMIARGQVMTFHPFGRQSHSFRDFDGYDDIDVS